MCRRDTKNPPINLTFFFHSCSEALSESAVSTLVSFIFVHHAASVKTTRVDMVFPYTSSEETLTTITTRCSIMFSCGPVSTDGTELAHPLGRGGTPGRWHGAQCSHCHLGGI